MNILILYKCLLSKIRPQRYKHHGQQPRHRSCHRGKGRRSPWSGKNRRCQIDPGSVSNISARSAVILRNRRSCNNPTYTGEEMHATCRGRFRHRLVFRWFFVFFLHRPWPRRVVNAGIKSVPPPPAELVRLNTWDIHSSVKVYATQENNMVVLCVKTWQYVKLEPALIEWVLKISSFEQVWWYHIHSNSWEGAVELAIVHGFTTNRPLPPLEKTNWPKS